jgi:FkbM family methyltransferase
MRPKISDLLRNTRRAPEIFRCARETSQWPKITATYLGFSKLPYPTYLRLRRGDHIRLQELTDLKAFWQIYLRRVYRVEASDQVILDIGANVGLFSLYAARQAPAARIIAVEPFPQTFQRLLEIVADHLLTDRIICLDCAISGAGGPRLMANGPSPSQQRALAAAGRNAPGIQVHSKTLRELLQEQALNRVDLLKMDIEGSEYEVLLSTSLDVLRMIRRIAIEYHGDCKPYTKLQLFDHLRQAGFEVTRDVQDRLGYGVAEAVISMPQEQKATPYAA